MSDGIRIQFTRFSAFYSPLIATIAGGFLKAEGFEPKHSVAPPGKSAIQALGDGTAHVVQSAPSQGFFQHAGLITRRHRYEDIVAPPPGA